MNTDLLYDDSARKLAGAIVVNLFILLWLAQSWLRQAEPKTSRLFAWSLLAVCGIVCLFTLIPPLIAH